MKKEFRYESKSEKNPGRISHSASVVMLKEASHESAKRAVYSAHDAGLEVKVFSFSDILQKVSEEQNTIQACAIITGTKYEEQLKSIFAADASLDGKHRPNAVLGVLKYKDDVDYKKMALAIQNYEVQTYMRRTVVGTLTSNVQALDKLGFTPGFIGVNCSTLWVPALFTPGKGESFEPYTDGIPALRVIDDSVRDLEKFCILVGRSKADALIVADGKGSKLGKSVDVFFDSYFGRNWYTVADIKR